MSLATITSALVAKALAQTSASVELDDPLARQTGPSDGITAISAWAVVGGWDRRADSNVAFAVARVELAVVHRLANANDEASYLEGDYAADLSVLMNPAFWEVADSSFYDVLEGPELEADRERIGRVVRYRVSAQIRFIP